MNSERQSKPFGPLGAKLKTLREKRNESMAEVSGAVEIDEQALLRIEQGNERPSEDILMLLISHFGMQDDEATILWQLAGYDQPMDGHHNTDGVPNNNRTMVMIMAVDPRIVYTDGVQIVANGSGVVMNFAQGTGTPQTLVTSRVGMSREQAKMMLRALQEVLNPPTPRQLPPSTKKS